jgi:menaquinone-dependent protoporphyrinogen IX oxidase/uncharacterized protein YhbP (UPF0306 family)
MLKTLVIYSSKYGSTHNAAKIIALVTGPSNYCNVNEFKPEYKEFDFIVIGSPIYQEEMEPSLMEFLDKNREWLKEKPVSLFCLCLDKNRGLTKLTELQELLGVKALSLDALGGRLIIDELDEKDRRMIEEFISKVKLPFKDVDLYKPDEIVNYSLKLKSLKDRMMVPLEEGLLRAAVEEFLTKHNTCTLATGHADRVRSTPIEYNYRDGNLYLLSEGGEKFANILLNDNVSLSVYESYTGMNSLAGIQMTGKASLVEMEDAEYSSILKLKGLNVKAVRSMPVKINLVKIKIDKVEFLSSKFKTEGAEAKQIYEFKD